MSNLPRALEYSVNDYRPYKHQSVTVTYKPDNKPFKIEEYISRYAYQVATQAAINWLLDNKGSVEIDQQGVKETYENI